MAGDITKKLIQEGVKMGTKAVANQWIEERAKRKIIEELDKMSGGGNPGEAPPVNLEVKEPWQMTKQEWLDSHLSPEGQRMTKKSIGNLTLKQWRLQEHGIKVWQAASEGKPIPLGVLKDYPDLVKVAPQQESIPVVVMASKKEVQSGVIPTGVPVIISDKETMIYQLEHLKAAATQLEVHLSEGCEIAGRRCDCCRKHAPLLKMYAQETIPIANRTGMDTTIYNEIIRWASRVEQIPMDAPADTFQQESGQAGVFRKRLSAMTQGMKEKK